MSCCGSSPAGSSWEAGRLPAWPIADDLTPRLRSGLELDHQSSWRYRSAHHPFSITWEFRAKPQRRQGPAKQLAVGSSQLAVQSRKPESGIRNLLLEPLLPTPLLPPKLTALQPHSLTAFPPASSPVGSWQSGCRQISFQSLDEPVHIDSLLPGHRCNSLPVRTLKLPLKGLSGWRPCVLHSGR